MNKLAIATLLAASSVLTVDAAGLLYPLYIPPTASGDSCTEPSWQKVANSAIASKTIIVANPHNGPVADAATRGVYQACINYMTARNVKVIGYVHTKVGYENADHVLTGYRALDDVKSDINLWYTAYTGISGIFIDEVSSNWYGSFDSQTTSETFYPAVVKHVQTKGSTQIAVLNPGAPYDSYLIANSQYTYPQNVYGIPFENNASLYIPANGSDTCQNTCWAPQAGMYIPGPWCYYTQNWDNVPQLKNHIDAADTIQPNQNVALVYGVTSSTHVSKIVTKGVAQHFNWFYVTDKTGWDIYHTLPSDAFWNELVTAISSN